MGGAPELWVIWLAVIVTTLGVVVPFGCAVVGSGCDWLCCGVGLWRVGWVEGVAVSIVG
jgi:hypothetical protein